MRRAPAKPSAKKPAVRTSSTRAAANAVLEFLPGWAQNLTGELRQGGNLAVQYDPDRLTGCRSVHNGVPSWELHGFVKFHPGEQLISGPLVEHVDAASGAPIVPPRPVPISLAVPDDATWVELWFKNSDMFGCAAWDSRMGENYRFEVQPPSSGKPATKAPRKAPPRK